MYEAELNATWGLDAKEKEFITKKYSDNRYASHQLAFAFAMKFFYLSTRYPTNDDIIHEEVIRFLAKQLSCAYCNLAKFDWKTSTAERYRNEISKFYGFKKLTNHHIKCFMSWLITDIIPIGETARQALGHAYRYFKEKKIEPCKTKELENHIHLAYKQYEDQIFRRDF